jgi:hypothetical protein
VHLARLVGWVCLLQGCQLAGPSWFQVCDDDEREREREREEHASGAIARGTAVVDVVLTASITSYIALPCSTFRCKQAQLAPT